MRHDTTTKKSGFRLGVRSHCHNPLRALRRGFQGVGFTLKSSLWIGGVASFFYAAPPPALAAILLSEVNVQGQYTAVDDPTTDGFDIQCTLQWANMSEAVPANNQIRASGSFGSHQGLYKITTDDMIHNILTPTYTILQEEFEIDYADGVVNKPSQSDTFKFHFNLGAGVTNQAQAQQKADILNAYITGANTLSDDTHWVLKRSINGEVAGNAFPVNFQNSPPAYVIPEPDEWIPFYDWLDSYGLSDLFGDQDRDGIINAYEYSSDTDPTNAESFPSISISDTNLFFSASSNCDYSILCSENITSQLWRVFTNLSGTGTQITLVDTNLFPLRYYRLNAWRK